MKRIILLLIFTLLVIVPAYAYYKKTDDSAYTHAFYVRLNFCIPMEETQPLEDGGKIVRRILGFKGTKHICNYSVKQYDASGKLTQQTTCQFNQSQIKTLKTAIQFDLNAEGTAKDVFDKFSKDESICKVENFDDDDD